MGDFFSGCDCSCNECDCSGGGELQTQDAEQSIQ